MTSKFYIGNLPVDGNEADILSMLRTAFESCGEITDLFLIKDKITNQHRGFGFICFSCEGEKALALNGQSIFDNVERPLKVDRARERRQQPLHANNMPLCNYNNPPMFPQAQQNNWEQNTQPWQ